MIRDFVRHRLFWPVAALVVLLIVNRIVTPGFFNIRMQDGHLYGSLIDILRNGAPTLLVALGMTLVIATRGIDLSVGAVIAIAGAISMVYIRDASDPSSAATVLGAVGLALVVSLLLGVWNGLLVSLIGIQPIIATLILMTAGRGVAMLITNGQIITATSPGFRMIGGGFLFTLPLAILIAAVIIAITAVLTRRTALGMLIESVGVNPVASRLAGVSARPIIWTVYVFCAFCAGVAGLMIASNVTAADANNAGLYIEMDAILAVVIGGTSLAGGKFSITGTVVGAFIIQTLTTTVYTAGIAPEITLVFKALVVIAVVLLQSPTTARAFRSRRRRPTTAVAKEVAA